MKRVLIVEDEKSAADLTKIVLEHQGYTANITGTGTMAIDYLKKSPEPPDLILLDILLPQINGIEVCKWVRSQSRFDNTPVIMFTALVQEEDRAKAMDAGANEYITKPVSISKLLEMINEFLQKEIG